MRDTISEEFNEVSGTATDISVPIESSDGERISPETSPLRRHVAILPLLKIITRDKKDLSV
ncbi:MAG: hypothetical protein DSZ28_04965 [Thiothrix sp.]|nr:MAG: hypothetical protein DSZ28_04965 [Thiothrix sp.]